MLTKMNVLGRRIIDIIVFHLPKRETAKLQNHNTAKLQNHNTAKLQNHKRQKRKIAEM